MSPMQVDWAWLGEGLDVETYTEFARMASAPPYNRLFELPGVVGGGGGKRMM